MKTSEELLAKAFADSPADVSKIVFRVRSSPLNRHRDAETDDDYNDAEGDQNSPKNWMEYAQMLEQSGMLFCY